MKVLIFIVMVIAIVVLWRDNKSKTAQLDDVRSQLDAANQQAIQAGQKAQEISAQLAQLQARLAQPGAQAYAPGSAAAAAAPAPRQPPSWFQGQQSGLQPSILDPHGPPP
jgi:hypothetical protein